MTRKSLLLLLGMLPLTAAIGAEATAQDPAEKPEEVVITGQRLRIELREQMWAAEEKAYAVFNQFNDEKRFRISCSKTQPTGTRFFTHSCQPEFEIAATKAHARDYYESLRNLLTPGGLPDGSVSGTAPPMEAEILRHQDDYKRKFREIAQKHPEFLRAIEDYSKARAKYEKLEDKSGK